MSVVAAPALPHPHREQADRVGDLHRLAFGRLTLDELVSGAWAALGAGAPAACLLCDGPMHPAGSSATAMCVSCGSELS